MITQTGGQVAARSLAGRIRRRLLVNGVVDPDEAGSRLPDGVRPHVVDGATVVGCCLLELRSVRPAGLPRAVGVAMCAAAHRISVDWTTSTGRTVTGVYVPLRLTDSVPAAVLGGRVYPGVHGRARFDVRPDPRGRDWRVRSPRHPELDIHVRVDDAAPGHDAADPVAATCIEADLGMSPDSRGNIEVVRMVPAARAARTVVIEQVRSPFFDSFRSFRPATSLCMEDVAVVWSPAVSDGPS